MTDSDQPGQPPTDTEGPADDRRTTTTQQAANLVGIDLTQPQVHTLAWVLAGRRADTLAGILAKTRTHRGLT